jgi:hypothetical protein
MRDKISKYFLLILVSSVIIYIFIENNKFENIQKDIIENGKISVGKYVKRTISGKQRTENNYFRFYIDGIEYNERTGKAPKNFIKNMGKFYKIKCSIKYKGSYKVLYNNPVTDTLEILNAGFPEYDLPNYYFNK